MLKIELEMPLFPGFYNTIFDQTDAFYEEFNYDYDYIKEYFHRDDLTMDDVVFNYSKYEKDVCLNFIREYFDLLHDCIPFVNSIEFSSLDKPTYYNFRNDELYAIFELNDNWQDEMKTFMDNNKDILSSIIKEHWSTRSGFISYISNDLNDWYDNIFVNFDKICLAYMIHYMAMINGFKNNVTNIMNNTKFIYDDITIDLFDYISEGVYENMDGGYINLKENS